MALAVNNEFELAYIDKGVAFFQAKTLDGELFMTPPEGQRIEGYI